MHFTALFELDLTILVDKNTNSKESPLGGSAPLAGPATAGKKRGQVESEKPEAMEQGNYLARRHEGTKGKPESANECGVSAFIH
jgi:hypothetical protein